jgi:hypothetical protein
VDAWKQSYGVKASYLSENIHTHNERSRVPFARKPVAPVTKIVLFPRNWSMLSNPMRERERERERKELMNDDCGDLKQEVDNLLVEFVMKCRQALCVSVP